MAAPATPVAACDTRRHSCALRRFQRLHKSVLVPVPWMLSAFGTHHLRPSLFCNFNTYRSFCLGRINSFSSLRSSLPFKSLLAITAPSCTTFNNFATHLCVCLSVSLSYEIRGSRSAYTYFSRSADTFTRPGATSLCDQSPRNLRARWNPSTSLLTDSGSHLLSTAISPFPKSAHQHRTSSNVQTVFEPRRTY